jgi:hypothetical protein
MCLSYIVYVNHWYEKHLQGNLKRTLNHKNYQQKVTKQFAVLKDSKGQFWKNLELKSDQRQISFSSLIVPRFSSWYQSPWWLDLMISSAFSGQFCDSLVADI